MGLTVAEPGDAAQREDILIVDAASQPELLKSRLAASGASQPALIVVATAAEVEAQSLRVLMNEKMIVLKPVHRIALHEALARAMGVELALTNELPGAAANGPVLHGHVLLVEDEPVNAAVAEGYLEALGCTSVWVKNGTEAVARSAGERFDLVLMDLNMPGMDGFAATALIRERERHQKDKGARVPIVALTAHDAVNYRDKVLKAEMDDILSKPYALEDCTRLLRRWLARAEATPAAAASAQGALKTPSPTHVPARVASVALDTIDASAVAGLRRLRAGQADLYPRLVDLFRPASAESLAQLRETIAGGDLPAAASVCHKLASSAANVGALVYAKQVRQLEQHCVAGDLARARELNETLQAAHAPLLDALQGLCLRASA